ncbi:hypothetical protein [Actinokineospora inagensis]|uniref:hypothetical protein n=1 Tax=Actinokineospora inagensis TaxID=103730 RepID=UPI001FE031DA|nr:hypothetical protein [Actinokineospora inagensis]
MEFLSATGKTIRRAAIEDLADESPNFHGEFTYRDTRLAHGDQSGITGEGSLSAVLISDVDLSGSRLGPVQLSNVRCDNVTLSNAAISAEVVRRTEILRSQAIGLRFTVIPGKRPHRRPAQHRLRRLRIDRNRIRRHHGHRLRPDRIKAPQHPRPAHPPRRPNLQRHGVSLMSKWQAAVPAIQVAQCFRLQDHRPRFKEQVLFRGAHLTRFRCYHVHLPTGQ